MRRRAVLGLVLVAVLGLGPAPAAAQWEFPDSAVVRGENVGVRTVAGEDAEVVAVVQRGDRVTVTGPPERADGDAFVPIQVEATGDAGLVRDLFIDPASLEPSDATAAAAGDEESGRAGAGETPTTEATAASEEGSGPGLRCAVDEDAADEADPDDPLAGRLGGSREAFEARFGGPSDEEVVSGVAFASEGCDGVYAYFREGVLTDVNLYAPGFEGLGAEDHGAEAWTLREAERMAGRLLPAVAEVDEPVRNVSFVEHHPGFSEALADRVPPEVFADVDNNPTQGQFSSVYQLGLESDDVLAITVQLRVEDPS